MIVFIIAWEFDCGGGFDWYYNKIDRDRNLLEEKNTRKEMNKYDYVSKSFDTIVPKMNSSKDVTNYLDERITDLFDKRG